MTGSAIAFLVIGATVLWGGLLLTLMITIKNERTTN